MPADPGTPTGLTIPIQGLPINVTNEVRSPAQVLPGAPATPRTALTRTLTASDADAVLVCVTAQTLTVPAGLPSGFGCSIKGTSTVAAGAGVTVTDVRASGVATPWCALVQTGTDTYEVVGGKA